VPSPAEATREGLTIRGRWGRREFVPFDEMTGLGDGTVTLRSGDVVRIPKTSLDDTRRALTPPSATGSTDADRDAFVAYVSGPWSPRRAVALLMAAAEGAGATDVHVEAEQDDVRVRLRRSGSLVEFATLTAAVGARLVAALKLASGCLPYRSDLVQEGRISRDGVAADVRTSFLPTALGERAALRLFGRLLALEALGFPAEVLEGIHRVLDARSGLFLVAGPSGGGKTTTVYAALAHLAATRDGAHLSIEDPVEQRLRVAGIPVDQVELSPERGLTAEVALAGALRQDVDVVALAEVRTEGEAALALRAAHTGRLVIAGVHAGSPDEARTRMLDLGAEGPVLEATLRGILHQRLELDGGDRRPAATLWEAP